MAEQSSIVKEGDAFALENSRNSLPFTSEMNSYLKEHPQRSNALWECLKKHKKLGRLQTCKKLFCQVKTLMGKYGKMLRSQVATFPISHGLGEQIRESLNNYTLFLF
jgi:hypothetical protein